MSKSSGPGNGGRTDVNGQGAAKPVASSKGGSLPTSTEIGKPWAKGVGTRETGKIETTKGHK